jgi:hypothetical protein
MAELTTSQRSMLRASVGLNRAAAGAPLNVSDDVDDAAALVRVGYAQWYPPLPPMGLAAAQNFSNDRTKITPTGRAQDWVNRYGPGSDV